jgi:acetyl esterase
MLNISERIFGDFLEAHKLSSPGKPLLERSIDDLRVDTRVFGQYTGDPANVSYVDQKVPARDGFPLSIRIYNDQLPAETPVFIYYPGCAFVFDLSEVNRVICSRIALQADIKVILVQFRLAPENPMPTSLYDGYDAAIYIATHPDLFGIDPHKIFLGGWCSGAHCATAVSSLAHQSKQMSVYHQILLSGSYDLTESNHDFDDYEKEDKILNRRFTAHIARQYYGVSPNDYQNPLLSPYHETRFAGLPPTTILVGEYDALRNDSESYFRRLVDRGISAEKVVLPGQTHNTIAMRKVLSDGPDPAQVIAEVIRAKLLFT